jgi:hypothetical protein
MPCHHALAEVLHAYINAAGIAGDRKGWLFRTARGHNGKVHSKNPMTQPDAWRMIRRRAAAAGIAEAIGCHTFRATGITCVSLKRRRTRACSGNGSARKPPHNQALRPDEGASYPGRGGTDQVVIEEDTAWPIAPRPLSL